MAFGKRRRQEEEFKEEVESHLRMAVRDRIERGETPEEAERAARKEFGNALLVTEATRAQWGRGWLETFWQDVRYGARGLRKRPGFTLVAVLTLALGIGANTAIFSVVNAVLLRPFPYESPERLVILQESTTERDLPASYLNFADWRGQNSVCSSMAAVRTRESFNFTGAGEPERLQGRLVSADFFSTLGVRPLRGRDFLAEEDRPGAAPAVILSYGFWQRRFGADEGVVGKQLTLNNQSFTVVGITPADFQFGEDADVSVPIGLSADRFRLRGKDPGILVVARLKPNVSEEQAEAELNAIAARLELQYPESNTGRRVRLTPLHEGFVGDVRQPLMVLLGAVGLVLLIACANVANLLLVRAAARQREMALRAALGAGRVRIIRQLLTESVLLSMLGGVLGMLLAFWGTGLITSYLPDGIPRLGEAGVDASVFGFTFVISLLTGMLFGLAPALQASRTNLTETLKEGDRGSTGRQGLRGALVVTEIALTLALLVGAGLLIKSFWRLQRVDPGFNPQNLLAMQISVNAGAEDGSKVANFFEQLHQQVGSLPGVKSVAVSNGLPIEGANQPPFIIEGRPRPEPGKEPAGIRYTVSPDYFQTLGIELLKGRVFNAQDMRDGRPVVVIDEALARQHFQNEDPLGKRLTQPLPGSPSYEIVGVVRHVEHYSLDGQAPVQAQFYTNFNQISLQALPNSVRRINLLVRTEVEPLSLASAVRNQIRALNKDQAVFNVRTMEQIVAQSVAARRFSALLLAVFAAVALVLASVGIYGVMSHVVAQRTHEIGIRMALGARGRDVYGMVIGRGMKLALAGVGVGLLASLALTRLLGGLLFGVSATDPATFAAIALLLTLVALLASYLPAWRAAKVDPLVALRYE